MARKRLAERIAVGTAEIVAGDADHLSWEDDRFSVATSFDALEFVPDPLAAPREMHQVLRPGGRMAVTMGEAGEAPGATAGVVTRGASGSGPTTPHSGWWRRPASPLSKLGSCRYSRRPCSPAARSRHSRRHTRHPERPLPGPTRWREGRPMRSTSGGRRYALLRWPSTSRCCRPYLRRYPCQPAHSSSWCSSSRATSSRAR